MTKLYFTEEQILDAVSNSTSTKEFLIHLGMKVNNGNYRKAEHLCQMYNLVLPKHDSSLNGVSLMQFNKIPDEEFFVEGVLRNGQSLKARLIRDHNFTDQCAECGQLPVWNGKPLTLELDHIDGNRFNNKIDNLRILCGHCHSQTPTYSNNRGVTTYNYCKCGVRIGKKSLTCKDCNIKELSNNNVGKIKIAYPPIPELLKEINESSFVAVAERLGVSDNAVRAYIRRTAGEDAIPRGYAKKPKTLPPSRGQKFLATANVHEVITEIEKPGNSLKSYASSVHTDPKNLKNWINEKLGYTYVAPRNKQTLNPNQGKVDYPSVEELLVAIANNGSERTAKSLGVTSKAVERHLRKYLPENAFPLLRSGFLENFRNK